MKVCIVLSSGGSVINNILRFPQFREMVKLVVTDRDCSAQSIAKDHGLELVEIRTKNNREFSDQLLTVLTERKIDLVLSFHLRLYAGELLEVYKNRMLNFHLSVLPAFPGFNSFENALEYGVKVLGSTIHFIDNSVDGGLPVMQTLIANDPNESKERKRHRIFIQQCRSILQVVEWFRQDRIKISDRQCIIEGAAYGVGEYVPALEDEAIINLFGDE